LENGRHLNELELILESGIIPKKYFSIINKQTYYPSTEERQMQSKPLPAAKHSFFCGKNSRKSSEEQKLSNFTVARDDLSKVMDFFIEHKADKKYPCGSFAAKVKKGFTEAENDTPKYAIKIFNKNMFSGNTIHELRLAMRAAYCYKQLGREGVSFRRNEKQYLVSEWLMGASLDNANVEEIQSMPIPRRIVMAISLLRELYIFHKQRLIHNDIKPSNVMVNYGRLNFIDLDSVRPKNEAPLHGTTPIYTDRYLPTAQMSFDATYHPRNLFLKFNEKTDIYAMGITLAYLFPEIYKPRDEDQEIKVNGGPPDTFTFRTVVLTHGSKYGEHTELQKLLKQMVFQEQSSSITANELIDAFKKVLPTYPDHEKYLEEDRLVNLGIDLSSTDAEKAFKEIEIELLGYNQRSEAVRKLSMNT
jgi:serine/threonine protein kinase